MSSSEVRVGPSRSNSVDAYPKPDRTHWRQSVFIVIGFFVVSLLAIGYVFHSFPELSPEEQADFIWPSNIEQAKRLGIVLKRYTSREFTTIYLGFFLTFVFLQAFAIPGTIFFCVLSGYIFNFPLALFTCCMCSALGASFCYLLSSLIGKPILTHFFLDRVLAWSSTVAANKHHLLYYIIFLRMTPFLPNWFINVASPVINVPLSQFFLGTFIGVGPPCVLYVQAGATLQQLSSVGDIFPWTSIIILSLFALLSLVPVIFKRRITEHFE